MFTTVTSDVQERLMDWHEVAALRVFTTFSDRGQEGLVEEFAALAAERDAITAQMWHVTARRIEHTPMAEREFVGDELAAALKVHPRTGQDFVATAMSAYSARAGRGVGTWGDHRTARPRCPEGPPP